MGARRTLLRKWAALLVLNTALGALRVGGFEGESSALRVGSPRSVASAWSNPLPLELQTVFRNGSVAWTRGAYSASVDAHTAAAPRRLEHSVRVV